MKQMALVGFSSLIVLIIVSFTEGCVVEDVNNTNITSFEQCIEAGYPVMESYPRQCTVPGIGTFTETLEMNQELCNSSGGHWNECSSKCMLENQGKEGVACTLQCEQLCECGGIAGFNCPSGYECKLPDNPDLRDALGYCIKSAENNRMPSLKDDLIENQKCSAQTGETMLLEQALELASSSLCIQNASITNRHSCNSYTGTWWIDLEMNQPMAGCNPACVVNVSSGQTEINWRCTGLIVPE